MKFTPELKAAVVDIVDVFDNGEMAHDLGKTFSCWEIECIAQLLRAAYHDEVADYWVHRHALDDDCGDSHCLCGECPEDEEVIEVKPPTPSIASTWRRWIAAMRRR
ncbi:hypothetical protein [Nocardia acidivorans]|uniref:hypothetical protein n=1 Tax=Nocardia acidivorans TaxID=404580 RepID=UPI00082D69F1|nr:hypothetical protein [Nocardia acidivorans]